MRVTMVRGPATVAVKGKCHVLGSDVSGRTIAVKRGKALPFEPDDQCELEVSFGRGSKMWQADPSLAGTSMWQEVASITLVRNSTIMLVGDTDTGKTTLCTYLANLALGLGMKPCIVDGDIGQGDLAPPVAIGAAAISNQVTDLRDVRAGLFEFIGSISPVGFERIVTAKLASITAKARQLGEICIVNTDGYARNEGISYKATIAKELQPDAAICVGDNPELASALESTGLNVFSARSSSQATKSRADRVSRRLDQFFRYVNRGTAIAELSQVKFVYRNRVFSPDHLRYPPIPQLDPRNIRGMFVGVGSNEAVAGFGIVTRVTLREIGIQTGVKKFDRVYLSDVRLSRDRAREIKIG